MMNVKNIKIGDIVKGQVTGITTYGVFVSLEDDYTGLVHISEISDKFVKDIKQNFNVGDILNVKVVEIDENKRQVNLSIKKIDYKVEKTLSPLHEVGTGFNKLKDNLDIWTKQKFEEIDKKANY